MSVGPSRWAREQKFFFVFFVFCFFYPASFVVDRGSKRVSLLSFLFIVDFVVVVVDLIVVVVDVGFIVVVVDLVVVNIVVVVFVAIDLNAEFVVVIDFIVDLIVDVVVVVEGGTFVSVLSYSPLSSPSPSPITSPSK